MEIKDQPILFYDGECGFCNRSVNVVLKGDRSQSIHFAALQSTFTEVFFEENQQAKPDLSTLYFWDGSRFYAKSAAAFRILRYFSWYYQPLQIFWLVPRFIRDWVYDQIAKRRQRISKGFCVMPTPEQRARFLDQSS